MNVDPTTLYRPTVNEVRSRSVVLTRLFADDRGGANDRFVEMATEIIGGSYEDITRRFALNIAEIDARGFDAFGYFTIGKEVWVARKPGSPEVIGFEVITRKRGGSIKLGPTLLSERFRKQGLAVKVIQTLLPQYTAAGARKVYVTAPLDHAATAALDLRSLGLQVEAILRRQYRDGGAERVFGRLLQTSQNRGIPARVVTDPDGPSIDVVRGLASLDLKEFQSFVLSAMADAYDDIDDSFVEAILSAHRRGVEAHYEEKGKVAYTLWAGARFVGAAICTPKRGGAVKVGPVLIKPGLVSRRALLEVVRQLGQDMRKAKRRKLFFMVPTIDWNVICVLSDLGLVMEGILREPYKKGCDVVVMSEFLEHMREWK